MSELTKEEQTDIVRNVVERQQQMIELAMATFNYFTKTFIWMSGGAFTALSLKEKLAIDPDILASILQGMALLVTIVGAISVFQIAFVLVRWYKYRDIEWDLCRYERLRPEWWAALYEVAYIVTIIAALVVAWRGKSVLVALIH